MAECQLPKLDVAGSNPVGRSNLTGGYGAGRGPLRMFGAHPVPTEMAMASGNDDLLRRSQDHEDRFTVSARSWSALRSLSGG